MMTSQQKLGLFLIDKLFKNMNYLKGHKLQKIKLILSIISYDYFIMY